MMHSAMTTTASSEQTLAEHLLAVALSAKSLGRKPGAKRSVLALLP
jgi:hypothetical protein